MTATHGLSDQTAAEIARILKDFAGVEKAVLFGSRAKGVHRPGSDIDLALIGQDLDERTLAKIDDALDDSLLPYRFSLVILDRVSDPEVLAHIRRVGAVYYERQMESTG